MNSLKEIRNKKGISQKKLAQKLEISPQRYNQYERARRKLPVDIAVKIANEFGITLDEIFLHDNLTKR
ncbi:helix-turn-helix transcriptional regulator [Clostridioides difficile]|nr:helix-turn-helix transcriptional regulator [Clostridioides difficile]HBH3700792.1 helix-turn-helix transcriptional regulator [Clostridioides difficile]HBH4023425.1 helix-turn-helix transcriptional regulator [Clostridioides difficile]HCU2594736.1 helix-turn-helix transcriptional regulator [Clostridioides difficile]